ncbi:MAG TPA: uridine diphosphate-N-acetylglucosamine-binding protein YvcK [Marmoricola sp.]|nr:uridine diphosphate-N-acetylglucosamine-binding protein YvcK [Marmoricola sp.]
MNWSDDPGIVALGGGHGLAASLAALRRITSELTAVVTVADNGGSSGRLRTEFGVLPPGDLRMALAALCGDDRWGQTWAKVLQHRFSSDGEMDGHAVGNLLIVALWELLDDHVAGLDWVADLLGARGRVLPMAVSPLDITADVAFGEDVRRVSGQVEVATTAGRVLDVQLSPTDPEACPEAVRAIGEAQWVVLGPGSWYSSVIPHVLVPGLRTALVQTEGKVLVTLNLTAQPGETDGFTPEDHLAVLSRHAPDLRVDTVLADRSAVPDAGRLEAAVGELGGRLVLADVARNGTTDQHDPEKLARAYAAIVGAN